MTPGLLRVAHDGPRRQYNSNQQNGIQVSNLANHECKVFTDHPPSSYNYPSPFPSSGPLSSSRTSCSTTPRSPHADPRDVYWGAFQSRSVQDSQRPVLVPRNYLPPTPLLPRRHISSPPVGVWMSTRGEDADPWWNPPSCRRVSWVHLLRLCPLFGTYHHVPPWG